MYIHYSLLHNMGVVRKSFLESWTSNRLNESKISLIKNKIHTSISNHELFFLPDTHFLEWHSFSTHTHILYTILFLFFRHTDPADRLMIVCSGTVGIYLPNQVIISNIDIKRARQWVHPPSNSCKNGVPWLHTSPKVWHVSNDTKHRLCFLE